MADRRRIIRQWRQGAGSVLVTLVRAEGSSYRRTGAHLLIGPAGEYSGSISGGCLEAEIVRKAAWIVRNGPVVERYSTLFDDTAEIPYGLGCGGVVDLLLEPVETAECRALLEGMEASLAGSELHVATWLPEQGRELQRAVFAADGSVIFASETLVATNIHSAKNRIFGTRKDVSINEPVYVEHLAASQRLIIAGAGEDAKPVVTMASLLGWRIIVADSRKQLARAERFPEAERVIATESFAELQLKPLDAVVLMTHSYEQDRALLTQLLSPLRDIHTGSQELPSYIGLLGAGHRSSLLIAEAAASLGIGVTDCCARIWAPIGLDLGGDGPEAITLAIIAEVQAWREGRSGGSHRLTADRVAEHLAKGGASRYLRVQCAMGSGDMAPK